MLWIVRDDEVLRVGICSLKGWKLRIGRRHAAWLRGRQIAKPPGQGDFSVGPLGAKNSAEKTRLGNSVSLLL